MNKIFEFVIFTFLIIAFIRGFHLISGRKLDPACEYRMNKEERKIMKLLGIVRH